MENNQEKIAFELIPLLMNPTLVNFMGHYEIDKLEGTDSKRSDDEKYLISVCLMLGITLPIVNKVIEKTNDHFLFMQYLLDTYNLLLKSTNLDQKCFPKIKFTLNTKSKNDVVMPNENIKICEKFVNEAGYISKYYKNIDLEDVNLGMYISFCTGMHYCYSYVAKKPEDKIITASGKEESGENASIKKSILNDGEQADKALHKLISHHGIKIQNI